VIQQNNNSFDLIINNKFFEYFMEENQDFKAKYSHLHNMKDLEKIIKNFISNLQYQEFNFTGKDIENDYVFNLLNKKEREELLAFFNSNKLKFINSLTDHIIKRKVPNYNEQISALIYTENAMDVYSNKIKKEISKISKNINEFEIKYLSIMLVGKSGVGKSTLINSVLKSNFAKEGTGSFQTINIEAYKSKNMPIFRLIDTRGIELLKNI
jgi:ABC-type glutathione transport system ATPase component